MKLAVFYAGQGAQHPGMGKEFYEASPAFRAAFDSAELDFDLHRVCFEDPDGVLNQTEYTQPCMVAFACGVTAVLAEQGVKPAYVAGLSLGEYSALQAAGVFTAKQAIELTALPRQGHGRSRKGHRLRHDRRAEPGPARPCRMLRTGCRAGLCADLQLQLPGPAGHRRRKSRCGQGCRAGKGSRCPPLHPAQGQRPLPHPADGSRRGCAGKALCGRDLRRNGDAGAVQLPGP